MNQAISITIEGSIWELIGKGVVILIAAFIVFTVLYLFFLAWAMGGWRPWHFITDMIERRRNREHIRHKNRHG